MGIAILRNELNNVYLSKLFVSRYNNLVNVFNENKLVHEISKSVKKCINTNGFIENSIINGISFNYIIVKSQNMKFRLLIRDCTSNSCSRIVNKDYYLLAILKEQEYCNEIWNDEEYSEGFYQNMNGELDLP